MELILIGYRGTGKSTVARLLASRLRWDCVDLDDEIEARAGKSIAAIFSEWGEAGFRELEAQALAELSCRGKTVLSCGGGVILIEANRRLLAAAGFVVWLRAEPQTIFSRVHADPLTQGRRPNLTTAGGMAEIESMLEHRTPWYEECADAIVDTDDRSPAQIADEILTVAGAVIEPEASA